MEMESSDREFLVMLEFENPFYRLTLIFTKIYFIDKKSSIKHIQRNILYYYSYASKDRTLYNRIMLIIKQTNKNK